MQVRQLALPAAVAPLGGQHDEIERVGSLDLEPGAAPPPGFVCRLEPLRHEAFLAGGNRGVEKVLRLLGVGRHKPRGTLRFGHALGENFGARRVRLIEQRRAVQVEHIKEERNAPAQAFHCFLKAHRTPVSGEHDRLAIQDPRVHINILGYVDDGRKLGGDVFERARINSHLFRVFVDLNPNAVELILERRRSQRPQCLLNILCRLRQHWFERSKEFNLEARDVARRHRAQIPRQHHGAPHILGRQIARLGKRFDHDPLERALAQLSRYQPEQKVLLFSSRLGKERAEEALSLACGSLARRLGDPLERFVDVLHVQTCRCADVRLGLLQRRPPHTHLSLARRPGEIGDHNFDLIGTGLLQQIRQQLDLGEPAGGRRYLIRGLDKGREKHDGKLCDVHATVRVSTNMTVLLLLQALTIGPAVDSLVSTKHFSGVVLIARGGAPAFEKAYGMADREAGRANNVETAFNLGSINKLFTQIAIRQLAAQGKLDIDSTLGRYWPDYPNPAVRRVTLRQLLEHRGGLGGNIFDAPAGGKRSDIRKLGDFLPLFVNEPMRFEPGTEQQYSNAGYVVLGLLVERLSGESYYAYVQKHIYALAGMTRTAHFAVDSLPENTAIGYTESGRNTDLLPGRGSSAGGGYSTAHDLLRL